MGKIVSSDLLHGLFPAGAGESENEDAEDGTREVEEDIVERGAANGRENLKCFAQSADEE
jgi:hypothetical protein